MPERAADLLFRFLRQNGGRLSGRAREREFAALTDEEVVRVEATYEQVCCGTSSSVSTGDPRHPFYSSGSVVNISG